MDHEQDTAAGMEGPMTEEHPFAPFIALLGRGKTRSRDLTQEEAEAAMGMILDGAVLPEQLGAFMMLMRYKEESPAEVAGFVQAVRHRLRLPESFPMPALDWSSYAGKRRHLPWFLFSAFLLAGRGYKVLMHGVDGHTPGRIYTGETLRRLGVPIADSLEAAADQLERHNFAYLPLEVFSPRLKAVMDLRPILGLRTPIHTVARMINPFAAPAMMLGIFHRGFMETHTEAGRLLGQPGMAVFRGDGGEGECRPHKPTEVWTLGSGGEVQQTRWPPLLADPRQTEASELDPAHMVAVWRGDREDAYATAAVTGTLAIALQLLGIADNVPTAREVAETFWQERDRALYLKEAAPVR